MSEEEMTLVIELQGVARKKAAKFLEAVKGTLEVLRFQGLVSGGKMGAPLPLCHGFLFKEPPSYDPLPFLELWDEVLASQEDVDLINAHARALRRQREEKAARHPSEK
ncbi:MAG TPA: hypothetical protein VMT42_02205 [candidate division Zixibacteria bacterium]|nr:hypothetical protein [candidate division Zixibacteria bacterium]